MADQQAGLLTAREFADRLVELVDAEAKAFGPGMDVDMAAPEGHRLAIGAEGQAQAFLLVEGAAVLAEPHRPQGVGALDLSRRRGQFADQEAQQGRFATTVEAEQANPVTGGQFQIDIAEDPPVAGIGGAAR